MKTDNESLLMTDAGNEFQTDGAAHRKERFAKSVRFLFASRSKHTCKKLFNETKIKKNTIIIPRNR